MLTSCRRQRADSIPRYGNLLKHLPAFATIRALFRQLALDAVAAVRTGPVQRHRLALVFVTLVGHGDSSSRGGRFHYDIAGTLSRPTLGRSVLGSSSANLVPWRTYIPLGQEYGAIVTCHVRTSRERARSLPAPLLDL